MALRATRMRAETGPIGADLSHDFIILAETGESAVYCDKAWLETDILAAEVDYDSDLEPAFKKWTSLYAATDDMHDAAKSPLPADQLVTARGIEVGHIFYFGTKYSKPMNAVVAGPNGETVPVEMGSYGIGVSRLVGAIIEASHDDKGIIWPEAVAPFRVGLINLRAADAKCVAAADALHCQLRDACIETLYDDRDESAGAKFATMGLVGFPWELGLWPRRLPNGPVVLRNRAPGG